MDLGLAGSSFLVTGGSRGLGLATAQVLVAEGGFVTITGRNGVQLETAVTTLGNRACAVTADNGDPKASEQMVRAALGQGAGRLDGVLVSVGGPPASALLQTDDVMWREAIDSVFLGALRIARAAIEVMAGGGAIGFVLSSSVRNPIPELAISNALRPALAMAAKTLADEVGPRGLRVFGLAPGRIDTDRTRALDSADPDARRRSEASIPLGRLGLPAEFGRVAAFLLSPAASYVTGCLVAVDGGLMRSL